MQTSPGQSDKPSEISPPSPRQKAADEANRAAEHPLSPEIANAAASITGNATRPADAVNDLMPKLHEATDRFQDGKRRLDEATDSNDIRRGELLEQVHRDLRKAEDDLEAIDKEMNNAIKKPVDDEPRPNG